MSLIPKVRTWLLVPVLALALAACTAAPPAPPSPTSTADQAAAAADDLQDLLAAVTSNHPDPWHSIDEAAFTGALTDLAERAPHLHPDARLVEVMRLVRLLGSGGRDGHMGIIPWTADTPGTHVYPIQLWKFPDGLYVVAAREPYEQLLGSRVATLAGTPIDVLSQLVRPLVPYENDQSYLAFGPMFLLIPEVLHGLGVLATAGPADLSVVRPDGSAITQRLEPIRVDEYRAWLGRSAIMLPPAGSPPPPYLLGQGEPLALTWDQSTATAYLRYRAVQPAGAVVQQFAELVASGTVDRVVVDLRWNPGGNNLTYPPLLSTLLDPAVDQPGRLYVLISRITFSAAANFATELDTRSSAIFVGEATGGSPNLYGDTVNHRMPWFDLTVRIPTSYWQKSTADDARLAIEPDIPVQLTAADYFSGRDPVLAAVVP
jgi:hypothetical protein